MHIGIHCSRVATRGGGVEGLTLFSISLWGRKWGKRESKGKGIGNGEGKEEKSSPFIQTAY